MKVIKNEKTAEIVGLCFGDGSLTTRHSGKNKGKLRFQMRGHITEDREHYGACVKHLFDGLIAKIPTTIYNGKKPYYGISTENSKICNYLVSLGIPIGVKKELKIPNWILENQNYMKGFLRGYFDTDGTIFCITDKKKSYKKIRISISSASKNLISELSKMLTELGITSVIVKSYRQKVENWNNLNRVQIDGENVVKYFKLIGSNNPKHATKFNVWRIFGFCPPHTTLKQRCLMLSRQNKLITVCARGCQSLVK